MIEIIMIMGFLGSGKTTLLERILETEDGKAGVIVNEFGAVSVDGERLSAFEGAKIMQVNSGSIFCACRSDFFIQSMLRMADMGLTRIYVEASGLSNPSSIEKIMKDVNTLNKTGEHFRVAAFVCVADAERIATLLQVSVAAVSQVQRSRVILLNKMDHADDAQKAAAEKAVRALNPGARVLPCIRCAVDIAALTENNETGPNLDCTSPKPISERAFTVLFSGSVRKSEWDVFLNQVMPICVRIKGYLTVDDVPHAVDVVPPYIDLIPQTKTHDGKLVLIVREDEKMTAQKKIETLWQSAFGYMPDEIVI